MREGWEHKTFGEVGSFFRGKNIQKTDFVENGLPCIHYGQIHTKFGITADTHYSTIPSELYEKSVIASKGDVLFTLTSEDVSGSCKATAWIGDYDVALSSDAALYRHSQNPAFIVYYMYSNSFYVHKAKYARGFKVTHIKTSDIANIPIPIPSLDVQQSIVFELDQINELIRLKKEQLKDYDNLAQSIFYEMFGDPVANEKGWEVKKLGEIISVQGGYAFKSSSFVEKGVKLVQIANVWKDNLKWDDVTCVPEEDAEIHKAFELKEGDIVMALTRPIIKSLDTVKIAIVNANDLPCVLNQRVCKYEIGEGYVSRLWFYNFAKLKYFKDLINGFGSKGMQPNVSTKEIESISIPLPPLSLQQSFAKRIECIEKLKEQTLKEIKDLETLLASRMQYWFD